MKVLIALDNHKATIQAWQWYMTHVYRESHQLFIFHLSKPPQIPAGTPETIAAENEKFQNSEIKLKEKAEKIAKEFNVPEKMFEYSAVTPSDLSSKAEIVAKEICEEIERREAELIVMGCRNTKMKKFLGSVSDYIIKETGAVCLVKKFE